MTSVFTGKYKRYRDGHQQHDLPTFKVRATL